MAGLINISKFQFHKGTIRTPPNILQEKTQNNFNSIKVRLELRLASYFQFLLKFQFHKGTIRTYFANDGDGVTVKFQFHKGTIRTKIPPYIARDTNLISIP